jgi:hypothetical protein
MSRNSVKRLHVNSDSKELHSAKFCSMRNALMRLRHRITVYSLRRTVCHCCAAISAQKSGPHDPLAPAVVQSLFALPGFSEPMQLAARL